uniref:G protein-coupled receptor n=1 Tax=Panagrellus redivivus TaxID=6233 RepID=A0A7E4VA67_PANRE
MSYQSDLLSQLECAEIIVSYIGLCINVLLIYLIRHHTIKNITPYKPILYQNCVTDFIYTISTIIVRPIIDVQNGTAFFFVRTIIPYESPYVTKFLAIWFDDFALMLYIAVVPVQFLYRYIFIVKRIRVTRKLHGFMLSVAVSCCAFNASLFYMTVKDCHKNMVEGLKILSADPAYNSENAKHFVFSNTHNIYLFLYFGSFLLLTIISGLIIIFTSHAVWKNTRNLKSLVARDAHDQMTRILLLQVGIPVFLCFIPVSFFIINTVLYTGPSLIPKMVLPVVSMFPIVNAILVMYFMKSYRNFFFLKLRRFRAFITRSPPETIYSTSNKSVAPHST